MRKEIFKKAAQLLVGTKCTLDGDKGMFFEVKGFTDDYGVRFEYNDFKVLEHSCTCRYMATSDPKNLCSHKIAVIAFNVIEELKKMGWIIDGKNRNKRVDKNKKRNTK